MTEPIEITDEHIHIGPDGSVTRSIDPVRRVEGSAPPAAAPPAPAAPPARPAWLDRGHVFDRSAAERAQLAAAATGSDDPVGQDAASLIHEARHDPTSPMYRALHGLDPVHEAEAHERLLAAYRALEPQNETVLALDESHEEAAQRTREETATREQEAFKALTTAPPVRDDGRTITPEAWLPAVTFAEAQGLAPADLAALGHQVLAAEQERQITDDDLRQLWGEDYDAKDARLADVLEPFLKKFSGEQREAVRLALAKRSVVARLDRILDRRAVGTA